METRKSWQADQNSTKNETFPTTHYTSLVFLNTRLSPRFHYKLFSRYNFLTSYITYMLFHNLKRNTRFSLKLHWQQARENAIRMQKERTRNVNDAWNDSGTQRTAVRMSYPRPWTKSIINTIHTDTLRNAVNLSGRQILITTKSRFCVKNFWMTSRPVVTTRTLTMNHRYNDRKPNGHRLMTVLHNSSFICIFGCILLFPFSLKFCFVHFSYYKQNWNFSDNNNK